MPDPQLYQCQTETIWFETYDEPCTSAHEPNITYSFDYETLFDNTKRVYIDINLKFQHAAILFRSGIEFDGSNHTWDNVFTHDFLLPITKISIESCYQCFFEECEEAKNPYKYGLEINEDLPEIIIATIIEKYTWYRSKDDQKNADLLSIIGIDCVSGTDTIIVINTTFCILDQILFHHPAFDKQHNKEAFSDSVPIPRYLTLKFKCLLIEYDDVQLNVFDMIMFCQTLDCALQMLVGNKSDVIIKAIAGKGITNELQQEYITLGTELFAQLKESLQTTNTRLVNLENFVDWNSLLR